MTPRPAPGPPVTGPYAPGFPGTTAVVGRRCVQFVLDRLLVIVPAVVVGAVCFRLFSPAGNWRAFLAFTDIALAAPFVLVIAAMWFFDTWWPYRHAGQTPAMRWLGLRVVSTTGAAPPLRACLIRTLLLLVDGFAWGVPGLILMIVSPGHQRLGDMLAGTVVVRARATRRAGGPVS